MKRIITFALIIAVIFSMSIGTAFGATEKEINTVYKNTQEYIYNTVTEPMCSGIGGEWVMYGLAKAGFEMSDEYIATYKTNVEKTVEECKGVLHKRKLTEYSRVIVAYNALGLDVTNVAGYNLADGLIEFDSVVWQGYNGPIWALIALDGCNYAFSNQAKADAKNITTADKLVEYILKAQHTDGGWSLSDDMTEASDPDMTGMAVYALAAHRTDKKVKIALDKAITCMSNLQESSGGYSTWGAETSESASQIICALSSLGIDANKDKRFIKNGNSVIDALFTYYDNSVCGFRHLNKASGGFEPVVNQMATEQANYALAFYKNAVPEKVKGLKLTNSKSKSITIKYSKDSIATGYQIKIATDSKFKKNVKSVTVGSLSKSIKELKKGTTYYVKVRAYKTVNGVKSYGSYSAVKKIKCK